MTAISHPRPNGTPTWIDLKVNDLDATRAFVDEVFGWTTPPGAPEYAGYTISQLDSRLVCGLSPAMTAEGQPQTIDHDYLTVYLACDDVDSTCAQVIEAGGSVIVDAADVPNSGRMAICADPQGVLFGLWHGAGVDGFAAENEVGFPSWFELATNDPKAAAEFFTAVFGLSFEPMTVDGIDYLNCDQFGIFEGDHGWNCFIWADGIEATMQRALANGATEVSPAKSFQYGSFGEILTPGGARLGIFEG